MRHKKRKLKLNRTSSHRLAMFANMSVSLIQHEQIVTTLPKAKALRPFLEPLVTCSGKQTSPLSVRRMLMASLRDQHAVQKLLTILGPRYLGRKGGYLRIVKHSRRPGDNAPTAVIEFVDRDIEAKGKALVAQLS